MILPKVKIFVDMDGVLAKWEYNSIETVNKKGYFANRPLDSVMGKLLELLNHWGYEIYILSAVFNNIHSGIEKDRWISKYFPFIPEENRIYVPYGSNKFEEASKIVKISDFDVLIDDYTPNLREWKGFPVKYYNGVNGTKGTWHGFGLSYMSDAFWNFNELKKALASLEKLAEGEKA